MKTRGSAHAFLLICSTVITIVNALILSGCANIVPPAGGPVDTIAPRLRSIRPADSSLNIKPKRIELVFDKYMEIGDLSKEMSISPLLPVNPLVTANMKRVYIEITDTLLQDNTTYALSLGNALKDNREGTTYKNFVYTFSTGSYFDSLSIKGSVRNAKTGMSDTGLIALLYPAETFNDSNVYNKKPLYTGRPDNSGFFEIKNLPSRPFRVVVLKDADADMAYLPGKDWIGFMDEEVTPGTGKDTVYPFFIFPEEGDTAMTGYEEEEGKARMRRNNTGLKEGVDYRVMVDTTQVAGSQDLNAPLRILISKKVGNIVDDRIFMSIEKEGTEIEAIHTLARYDSVILLHTGWVPDSRYTLRLVKGWATDTSGAELAPGKYIFTTWKTEDYGTLKLVFPATYVNSGYIFQLYKGEDSIAVSNIKDSVFTFNLLNPGNYTLSIVQDTDGNGIWSSGNYRKKVQPEKVIPNNSTLMVKAGWEHEERFIPATNTGSKGALDTRPGAKKEEEK